MFYAGTFNPSEIPLQPFTTIPLNKRARRAKIYLFPKPLSKVIYDKDQLKPWNLYIYVRFSKEHAHDAFTYKQTLETSVRNYSSIARQQSNVGCSMERIHSVIPCC